jgi:hypothetical protein
MEIKLTNRIPSEDGYFLFKINPTAGLHLVLLQTDLAGNRSIIPDTFSSKSIVIGLNEAHESMFKDSLFSESPISIIV